MVLARFAGGTLTSNGGAVLLREVERVRGILRGMAACLRDGRDPARVRHAVGALVRQRVYGLALGYEDPPRATGSATLDARDPGPHRLPTRHRDRVRRAAHRRRSQTVQSKMS